jgi:hypothetical protein
MNQKRQKPTFSDSKFIVHNIKSYTNTSTFSDSKFTVHNIKSSTNTLPPDINYEWKALTIKQPWANLISDGLKTVENRSKTQYKHSTLVGKWIFIHSSISSYASSEDIKADIADIPVKYHDAKKLPRGFIVGIAKINGVFDKQDVEEIDEQWAHDGDACILFDIIYKLKKPVKAPGGLSTWKLKPSAWKIPIKKTKKEQNMTITQLDTWRAQQKEKYKEKSSQRHTALNEIMNGDLKLTFIRTTAR